MTEFADFFIYLICLIIMTKRNFNFILNIISVLINVVTDNILIETDYDIEKLLFRILIEIWFRFSEK